MPRPNKALYRWHLTIHSEITKEDGTTTIITEEQIKKWCIEHAKKWIFQKEKGETTGREHFQVKVSLKKRRSAPMVKTTLREAGLSSAHYSPEMTENDDAGFEYCMKEETKIDGPWSDKDRKPAYKSTKETQNLVLLKWQMEAVNLLLEQDDREILFVVDPKGASGKSTLAAYLRGTRDALQMPGLMTSPKEIIQMTSQLMKIRDPSQRHIIILDIPRAMLKEEMGNKYTSNQWGVLLACLESMKDGLWYDGRYSALMFTTESPRIIVFTNSKPPEKYITKDRIKIISLSETDDEEILISEPNSVTGMSDYEEDDFIVTEEMEEAIDSAEIFYCSND